MICRHLTLPLYSPAPQKQNPGLSRGSVRKTCLLVDAVSGTRVGGPESVYQRGWGGVKVVARLPGEPVDSERNARRVLAANT